MRPWTRPGSSLVLLLALLVLTPCQGATSCSALLWGSRIARLVRRTASSGRTGSTVALTAAAAATPAAFVGRSASVTGTGFRQFSQRATRLQCKLQKNYSLRAIVGDVYTNNGDSEDVILPKRVNVRPFVSSITTIAANAAGEALEGFVGGYLLGALTDGTRRFYHGVMHLSTPASIQPHVLPYPSLTRFSQQSLQFHAHNLAWATEWAKISAVFAACRTVTKILRHNQDDAWNSVVGSAMAGALLGLHAKGKKAILFQKLPKAMTRGALLYGGTMFLLHPQLWKQGIELCGLTLTMPAEGDNDDQSRDALGLGIDYPSGSLRNESTTHCPWYDQILWVE